MMEKKIKPKKYVYLKLVYVNKNSLMNNSNTLNMFNEYFKFRKDEYEKLKTKLCLVGLDHDRSSLKRIDKSFSEITSIMNNKSVVVLKIYKFETDNNYNKNYIHSGMLDEMIKNENYLISEYEVNDFISDVIKNEQS